MKTILLFLIALLSLVFSSCKRDSIDRLVDPTQTGGVPLSTGEFFIFEEELLTGGGLGFFPGGENQSITLEDRSPPKRSLTAIRYEWNGQDVAGQHDFSGFSLTITSDFTGLAAAKAKDLSRFGYTQLRFYLRGSLDPNTFIRVEGPDDNNQSTVPPRLDISASTLTSHWQEFAITGIAASEFVSVKEFFKLSFQYTQPPRTTAAGQGGVVYIDDIRFTL